ncbi:prephenate dehydratase [Timonella sp. A28]|uniref:prephenate dehydratase n=1 Tax=Timonella sp. A28 TaxID=3442640 RepID=UPI003EC0C594
MHTRVGYLGPEGTFTHQAALSAAPKDALLLPLGTVTDVYDGVEEGTLDYGIVAIESSVEGYVVPSLDALVAARNVVAVDEVFVSIAFDAFVRPDAGDTFSEIVGHPHGLAQCRNFISQRHVHEVSASSNAAACRDIQAHQIALGPALCGELYSLERLASNVQDFSGARTRFLLITSRDRVLAIPDRQQAYSEADASRLRTMLAVTPKITGPGVLARISNACGERDVNMSSLITRPLKALEGKYTFIITVDAAPWHPELHDVLEGFLHHGDAVKTLGVFPARGEIDDTVDQSRIAPLSADSSSTAVETARALLW